MVKALIASESGFDPKSGAKRKGRNAARGLMQVNSQAVRVLGDEKCEIKDHYVALTGSDRFDPNLSSCVGVRWLFQKRALTSHRLKREASWDEAVEEYKGVLKDRLAGKKINRNVTGVFRKHLKGLEKCGKKS